MENLFATDHDIKKSSTSECRYNADQYTIIAHITAVTVVEYGGVFQPPKDTPYLALTAMILGENWPCYNGTTLYHWNISKYYILNTKWQNPNPIELARNYTHVGCNYSAMP